MRIADMTGSDTGGQSFKLVRAINEYTDHVDRSFVIELNYINFEHDFLRCTFDKEFVSDYLAHVDVVHCHNKYRYANGWANINPDAKWVLHQHGRFADDTNMKEVFEADKQRGAIRVVSTFNLLNYVDNDPERWIPAPFRIREMEVLRKKNYRPSDKIRIAHSPTNRKYKNTDLLIDICSTIPEVELVLIENMPYAESLRLRSTCDITYDQMHLCYGNSGLEGMCFGQPTIVGMSERVRDLVKGYIGHEPYIFATPETLKSIIFDLVHNEGMRTYWGSVGKDYVTEWHDDRKVADRILKIYKKLQ